jgi:hypothetical protein
MQDIFFNIFSHTDIIIFNKITLKIFNDKHYWINNFKFNDLPILDNIVTGKDYYKTYMKLNQSKEKMIKLRKELENDEYEEKIVCFHFTLNTTNVDLKILKKPIKTGDDFVYIKENNIEIYDIIPNDVILELKSKANVLYANFGVLSHYININLETGEFYYEISNCYINIIDGNIPSIKSNFNIPLNDINNYIIKLFYTYDKMDNFMIADELGFII